MRGRVGWGQGARNAGGHPGRGSHGAVLRAARQWHHDKPDTVVISWDISNALNSVDVIAVLLAVPEATPWVDLCNAAPSHFFCCVQTPSPARERCPAGGPCGTRAVGSGHPPCHPLGALFDLLMTLPVKRVQRITAHVSHLVVWCPARPVRVLFLPPHEIAVHSKCSPAVLVRGAAWPESGLPFRRPPPRRGSTWSAAAFSLPLPPACENRRGASGTYGMRSRAQKDRLRRKRRVFRWSATCKGGPLGLGVVLGVPGSAPCPVNATSCRQAMTRTSSSALLPMRRYPLTPICSLSACRCTRRQTSLSAPSVLRRYWWTSKVTQCPRCCTRSETPLPANVSGRHAWLLKLPLSTIHRTRSMTLLSAH